MVLITRASILFRALWFPWLLLLVSTAILITSASPTRRGPRLGTVLRGFDRKRTPDSLQDSSATSKDYVTHFYDQTLDHFNFQPQSYTIFKQKYVVNSKHWRRGPHGAAGPIFAYMGDESPINASVGTIGFLTDNVRRFGAMQLYIEHRFYGESIPAGLSFKEALGNATIRGYFSSAQALADYAEIIRHVKETLSAESAPVVVVGGSYGGMLAAWFRLHYPHITVGALASSAPILSLDYIVPENFYDSTVTKDFKEYSWSCYNTIKQSWSVMERVAAKANGLSILTKKFKTCKPLKKVSELMEYLDTLYSVVAQYDNPPDYPLNVVCNGIDNGTQGTDILGRIFSGIVAYIGKKPCYDFNEFWSSESVDGWDWQTCSEIVQPFGRGANDTMFYASPFDYKRYTEYCKKKFGIIPRPHWITTYYGGFHIKEVLKRFGSNIIFSNGLRDPYSGAGVLENISKSIVAVTTAKGAHCLDIVQAAKKHDPEWQIQQRKKEVRIIKRWIHQYYKDLQKSW